MAAKWRRSRPRNCQYYSPTQRCQELLQWRVRRKRPGACGEPRVKLRFNYGSEKGLMVGYRPLDRSGVPVDEWGGGWQVGDDAGNPLDRRLLDLVNRLFLLLAPLGTETATLSVVGTTTPGSRSHWPL